MGILAHSVLSYSHFVIQSFGHFGTECFVIQSSCFHVTQLLVTRSSCDTVTSAAPPLVAKLSRHIKTLNISAEDVWNIYQVGEGTRQINPSHGHAPMINVDIEEISSEIISDCLDITGAVPDTGTTNPEYNFSMCSSES